MELFIELHDHRDVLHDEFRYKFDCETKLDQSEDKICAKWFIPKDALQLFLESGKKLIGFGETSIKSLGVEHGGKVIGKHSQLLEWKSVEEAMISFEKSQIKDDKILMAQSLTKSATLLSESGFFLAYPRFKTEFFKNSSQYYKIIDKTQDAIEKATKYYFEDFFFSRSEQKPKITFRSRFYVKTNHDAGRRDSTARLLPNLKELFAYKLLEHIGIGPAVHFPANFSTLFLVYIATEEIENLKLMREIRDEDIEESESRSIIQDKVVQAYLLSCLLGLVDLNEDNFGVDDKNNLWIFDFCINDSMKPSQSFHTFSNETNFGQLIEKRSILLKEVDAKRRLTIAKTSIAHWQLKDKLKAANKDMEATKVVYRKHGAGFEKGTKDLDNYIRAITERVQSFDSL